MPRVGSIESFLVVLSGMSTLVLVDVGGGVERQTGVVILVVIPGDEGAIEGRRVLDQAEPLRKLRTILFDLELAFGKWSDGMTSERPGVGGLITPFPQLTRGASRLPFR